MEQLSKNEREQVTLLPQTTQLLALMTKIRDRNTARADFVFFSDRIIRLLVEEGLCHLPAAAAAVTTPTGARYDGVAFGGRLCGVSIMRAGEAMELGLRECCRSVRIGKILIQRDEATKEARLFYAKLPADIAQRSVLLLDPMLATGGSVRRAIAVLEEHGVAPQQIVFLNLISCPEGIRALVAAYPQIRIVTAAVDAGLNADAYIEPGLGDFGCRYFGTEAL